MSQLHPKERGEEGFTLLEVMVATCILVVGMMATALLLSKVYQMTDRSRYMSMASTFCSEKLEDLERWGPTDPAVSMSGSATSEGSLTSDASATISGTTQYYYDMVGMTVSNGVFSETTGTTGSYTTTKEDPEGHVTIDNSAPTSTIFKRRWLIEKDQPVTGVRRITVLVTLMDQTIQPPVSIQMSAVRQ